MSPNDRIYKPKPVMNKQETINDDFPILGSNVRRAGNRRRTGFTLTQRRDAVPLVTGAAVAACLLHVVVYLFFPEILRWEFGDPIERQVKDEDTTRVFVRPKDDRDIEEAEPEQDTTPEVPEVEEDEPQDEPEEIDIIDMQIEELTMAPGQTSLPMPTPIVKEDTNVQAPDILPAALAADAIPVEAVPVESIRVADPTPVNANAVVVNADPAMEAAQETEDRRDADLLNEAKKGNGELPADTRSLSELIGMENLGASSGVARLGTDVLFEFNRCCLRNSARVSLLQLAALIQKNPNTNFVIEGHTDGIGGEEYNALLSLQRAAAVREWLKKNHVPVKHVYLRGSGSKFPLVSTKGSKEEQSLNRRVEVHMRKSSEKMPSGCLDSSKSVDMVKGINEQLAAGVRPPAVGNDAAAPKGNAAAKPTEPKKAAPAAPEPARENTANIPPPVVGVAEKPAGGSAKPKESKPTSSGSSKSKESKPTSTGRGKTGSGHGSR